MNQDIEILLSLMYQVQRDLKEKELTRSIILSSDKLNDEDRIRLAHACDSQMEEWKNILAGYQEEYQKFIEAEARVSATREAENTINNYIKQNYTGEENKPSTK